MPRLKTTEALQARNLAMAAITSGRAIGLILNGLEESRTGRAWYRRWGVELEVELLGWMWADKGPDHLWPAVVSRITDPTGRARIGLLHVAQTESGWAVTVRDGDTAILDRLQEVFEAPTPETR